MSKLGIFIFLATSFTTSAFVPVALLPHRTNGGYASCTRARLGLSVKCVADASESPKRKQMPAYVQELLTAQSAVENPLDPAQLVKAIKSPKKPHKTKRATEVNTEVFVRGLPWHMDRKDLRVLFSEHSPVYARVVMDVNNRTKNAGYGFVGFASSSKARAAVQTVNGKELATEDGKQLLLSVELAAEKGVARKLSSKRGQEQLKSVVEHRKKQLDMRDRSNVVMSADAMPRRWKAIQDQTRMKTSAANTFQGPKEEEEDNEDVGNKRAERALAAYLEAGNVIEDVTPEQLAREAAEGEADDDDLIKSFLDADEDSDEEDADGNWRFVENDGDDDDDTHGTLGVAELIEDEEEERRNWEEFKRAQLKGKASLRPADESKPSGALRSGQKKVNDQRPRPVRGPGGLRA